MWSPHPRYLQEAKESHEKPRITTAVVTCGFLPEIFYWILLGPVKVVKVGSAADWC